MPELSDSHLLRLRGDYCVIRFAILLLHHVGWIRLQSSLLRRLRATPWQAEGLDCMYPYHKHFRAFTTKPG